MKVIQKARVSNNEGTSIGLQFNMFFLHEFLQGIHLDRRLTWQKHIFTKRKQLGLQLHRMYWIMGRKSQLSLENKLLLYKTIIKPIWTYGIPLWGTASNFNIDILQRFQNKVLRSITNAPWYVPNTILHTDLQIPTVKAEITTVLNIAISYSYIPTNSYLPS